MSVFDNIMVQDVSGMTEHYRPVLNESGGEIKNGHLSVGMRVTFPSPFGGMISAVVEDGIEIPYGTAWAASEHNRHMLMLDPVRAIWVFGNTSMSKHMSFAGVVT